MSFNLLVSVQFALIVASIYWMLKKNDELPLLASACLFYVASYRFWAIETGINIPVNLSNFGFEPVSYERALYALGCITLGEICFLAAYMGCRRTPLPPVQVKTNPSLLAWLRPRVIILGIASLPLVAVVRGSVTNQAQGGVSMGFEMSSYLVLLPLMLVGIAILLLCLWRFGGLPDAISKFAAIMILCGLAYSTFGPAGRFQFLGWITGGGIVLSSAFRPVTRLVMLVVAFGLALTVFTVAGAMRQRFDPNMAIGKLTLDRAVSAEDANMLDGFVLLQQVYPSQLPYSHGGEHLEILLRPIPRKIWPDKPVGGYMNKLGKITKETGFTLGISPTLFGSLYGEGAIPGIVIGSILYGLVFAGVINLTRKMLPLGAVLIRAAACTSLIPLLRGGDLPGIYAWIGMAFWPCFLVLFLKRKMLFSPSQSPAPDPAGKDADRASFNVLTARFMPVPVKKPVTRTIGHFQSRDPQDK